MTISKSPIVIPKSPVRHILRIRFVECAVDFVMVFHATMFVECWERDRTAAGLKYSIMVSAGVAWILICFRTHLLFDSRIAGLASLNKYGLYPEYGVLPKRCLICK